MLKPRTVEREESATTPTESRFSTEAAVTLGYRIHVRALGPAHVEGTRSSKRFRRGHCPSSWNGSEAIRVPAAPDVTGVRESWGVFSQTSRMYVVPSAHERNAPMSWPLALRSYARLSPARTSPRFDPGSLSHVWRSCWSSAEGLDEERAAT